MKYLFGILLQAYIYTYVNFSLCRNILYKLGCYCWLLQNYEVFIVSELRIITYSILYIRKKQAVSVSSIRKQKVIFEGIFRKSYCLFITRAYYYHSVTADWWAIASLSRLYGYRQWRTQEFCSGGGGFKKFSWGQRTERTGIWWWQTPSQGFWRQL